MSEITNHPMILDETGNDILAELKIRNGYLQMITGGKRADVYDSMTTIAAMVRGNTLAKNAALFPVGDQIIQPWKDMDDSNHNTDQTAYQVAWDIVHHGMVKLQDGRTVPGMFLQMHKCSAYGVQFDHPQAFLKCTEALPAGTYHLTIGQSWGQATVGKTYQFTLTQAVPAGGRLSGFEQLADNAPTSWKVKSWATPADASPIETVSLTEGDGGTNLGTMPYQVPDATSGLNGMQQVGYGSNRWKTCGLRQYLNKSGNNWFAAQGDYDIRPDQYSKKGFMSGFREDFLNAIKPVEVTTALNTVQGFANASETTFDTFFLPSLQQMNVTPQLANVEGDVFEYWRERLALSGYAATYPTVYNAFKIPAINADSVQYARLRSAHRGNAYNTWSVSSSGYVYYYTGANFAVRFSPVCVIC